MSRLPPIREDRVEPTEPKRITGVAFYPQPFVPVRTNLGEVVLVPKEDVIRLPPIKGSIIPKPTSKSTAPLFTRKRKKRIIRKPNISFDTRVERFDIPKRSSVKREKRKAVKTVIPLN